MFVIKSGKSKSTIIIREAEYKMYVSSILYEHGFEK